MARRTSEGKGRKRFFSLERMYDVFGNIHADNFNFDKWWEDRIQPLLNLRTRGGTVPEIIDAGSISQCATEIRNIVFSVSREDKEAILIEKM